MNFFPLSDSNKDSLDRYRDHHIETGGFLRAVLENDLKESCARADSINMRLIPDIVSALYNDYPSAMWGSPERVEAWLAE